MGLLHKAADLVTSLGVGGITDGVVTTIPLVSVTGFTDGDLVQITVDRRDSNGIDTPSKREVIRGTVNGLTLINCTRAVEGSAQAHATGALVECIHTANTHNQLNLYISEFQFPGLHNGKVVVSNPGGVLTASIKTLLNADPSPNAPVRVIVNNELRIITTPLTVTVPAGFNVFNTGSAEMATFASNYFVFIGVSTSNKTALGIARFPYYRTGSQFIDTIDSNYYGRFADTDGTVLVTPTAVTNVVLVDRFQAIQSAGAGYTWSAAGNVYGAPINVATKFNFNPVISSSMGLAITNYQERAFIVHDNMIDIFLRLEFTTSGTATNGIDCTIPVTLPSTFTPGNLSCNRIFDSGNLGGVVSDTANANKFQVQKYNSANWNLGSPKYFMVSGTLPLI
jgi:hypothetical protein